MALSQVRHSLNGPSIDGKGFLLIRSVQDVIDEFEQQRLAILENPDLELPEIVRKKSQAIYKVRLFHLH